MIQIKKTILTLVALLAVTTGAWADETLLLTIESKDYTTFKSGSKTFDDKVTVTFSVEVKNDGDTDGWFVTAESSLLTVAGTNGYTITSCKFYTGAGPALTGYTVEGESPSVYLSAGNVYTDDSKSVYIGYSGITKIEVYGAAASSASGPEVAWNKATKTGTFDMPGGNVTLEPEYYPQAEFAMSTGTEPYALFPAPIDAIFFASTDQPLVSPGRVADIPGSTDGKKQGTVMFYVSKTNNLTEAQLIALVNEGKWSPEVPNAADIKEACEVYVYYYIKGNEGDTDETTYSDGDMNATALTVTIAAEPTYAVTFADGTDEPTKWTATPNTGLKQGDNVTVTYTGSKKVIGVKAEKKKAAPKLLTLNIGGETSATIYYIEGESWKNAIENHPTENAGWRAFPSQITYDGSAYVLFYGGGNTKVNPEENIDSTKNYKMES